MAIIYRCLLAGAAIVVPGEDDSLEEAIDRHGVTHLSLVATQLRRWLGHAYHESAAKRSVTVLLGGGANPVDLVKQAVEVGLKVCTSYGLTEMASQVTTTALLEPPERLTTSGRLLRHREIKIAGNAEILVRGKTLFKGYIEQGEVRLTLTGDGWFATGDTGRIDEDGYLTVTGRIDNMFISGGENIQPEEIEAALLSLDDIEEAIVVGVDDVEFGQRPVAFVKRPQQQEPGADQLREALGKHLPRFKIPVKFFAWPPDYEPASIKSDRGFFKELAVTLMRE